MSVFTEDSRVNNNPNRNTFDGSFANHLTMKMGTLYPAFVKEVVPGDTFDIQTAFGFKFMPLVFPVQSHMKACMHFFYVRNRNLHDEWENMISGLPDKNGQEIIHPYLAPNTPTEFKTGSLADYLGLPTTKPTLYDNYSLITHQSNFPARLIERIQSNAVIGTSSPSDTVVQSTGRPYVCAQSDYRILLSDFTASNLGSRLGRTLSITNDGLFIYRNPLSLESLDVMSSTGNLKLLLPDFNSRLVGLGDVIPCVGLFDSDLQHFTLHAIGSNGVTSGGVTTFGMVGTALFQNIPINGLPAGVKLHLCFAVKDANSLCDSIRSSGKYFPSYMYILDEVPTIEDDDSVYRSGALHINALPFRAYEQCCRCFYQDDVLQPMLDPVTGLPAYNRFVRNTSSGADSLKYELMRRNYEADFLTTCRPSPQFGNAPLVGLTALNNLVIVDDNGITTAQAEVDSNGTITNVVLTSPAADINHARTAMNIASVGMSINDFRNANALQKFLEVSLRKGFKYLDFIEGHFGKAPDYKEFKLPEFIGGFVQNVEVASLTNMSESDAMQLGEFVGQASCFGGSKHNIHHYCDDFGYIMGILSIVPDPTYQTLLPKHFLHAKQLDYYFPEMALIGPQPVPKKEVAPIFCSTTAELEETFGYQRPNYDLVANVDECHGQFRTTLSNFLIQRYFSNLPSLGNDFLQVDPLECNQIFGYTAPDADNIIGQLVFDVKMTRPIPRISIPTIS